MEIDDYDPLELRRHDINVDGRCMVLKMTLERVT